MQDNYAIIELLNAKEGEQVQFKEAKNRFDSSETARICCALSNCGGGKLVFGISDKRPRQVIGSAAFDQPERTRKGLIEKLKVMVDFQLYEYKGKRVLVFDVASRPLGLPVQVDGVAWWYEGDSLIPMPEDIRRKIYEEIGVDFSGTICNEARIGDIDENAVEIFRKKWIEKSGNTRLKSVEFEQLLRDCEAITEEGITYAALILFGKHAAIRRFCHRLRLCLNIVRLMHQVRQVNVKNSNWDFFRVMIVFGSLLICEMISNITKMDFLFMIFRPLMSG